MTIHETVEEANESIIDTAKHAVTKAASDATLKEMDGKRVVTNDGGQTLLDTMQAILKEQRTLRDDHGRQISELRDEYGRQISELKTRMGRMERLGSFFIDVRERAFLTHLRDTWRQQHVATQVQSLSRSIVHGGHAEADALMFSERRPAEELRQFVCLYGFDPEKIQDLAARGLRSTLQALNAVGGFHLGGKRLITDEEKIFEEIKALVNDSKFDEAEEVSKKFPFQKGFIEFDPIIEME